MKMSKDALHMNDSVLIVVRCACQNLNSFARKTDGTLYKFNLESGNTSPPRVVTRKRSPCFASLPDIFEMQIFKLASCERHSW